MPEPHQTPAEYHDEYSETLGTEFRKLEDALLSDTVSLLASADPIRLDETTGVGGGEEAHGVAQQRVLELAKLRSQRLRILVVVLGRRRLRLWHFLHHSSGRA